MNFDPPSTEAASDAQDILWMEQIRNGDTEAFRALVEAHQNRVVGMIAKMLGDQIDHEDIAQQVFLRIWKSADRYKPTAKFTTWLFKIVRNLVLNEVRRRKRHKSTSLDAEESHFQTPDPQGRKPDQSVLDEELSSAIQSAIDALPEIQRTAVLLRRYQEMPYEEMAKVLGVTVPAVKSVLFRARAELRLRLKPYLDSSAF